MKSDTPPFIERRKSGSPPTDSAVPISQRRRWQNSLRNPWLWVGIVFVLGLVFWGVHAHKATGDAHKKSKGGGTPTVAVAKTQSGDMPVYLEGLGSVTPYYAVTVRSRVDGQLMSVNFREGQYVHAGDELALIDPRPFEAQLLQAEGVLAKDSATLANAKVDLERYQGLVAQNALPKQQLDTQVSLVGQLEGTVKTDEASVSAAKLQVTYAHVTAPISGRVGLRLVDPGNMVHASDATGLLVVAQLQPITVVFTLPEDSLPPVLTKLHAGEMLTTDAYNRDKSLKIASGRLLTADNQIDPNTGTLKLKAVFDNKDNSLFPNQFVNLHLLVETRKDQVLAPAVAVQRGSQGTYVYVVKSDGTAEMRPVKIGITNGETVSIDEGLKEGETIVIDGADKVQPDAPLMIASNPDAAKGTQPAAGKHHGHRKRE